MALRSHSSFCSCPEEWCKRRAFCARGYAGCLDRATGSGNDRPYYARKRDARRSSFEFSVLRAVGLHKSFGGVQAVRDVSLST
jgi:hypothetical protein